MAPGSDLSQRKRYARVRMRLALIRLALPLLILSALLFLGQHGAFNPGVDGIRVILIIWLLLFITSLPLKYLGGFRIEHAFGLSRESRGAWAIRTAKAEILGFVFFVLIYGTLISLRYRDPDTWWVTGTILGILLFLVLGKLVPKLILPLFYKTEPVKNSELADWLGETCRRIRITPLTLVAFNLGKETRKANAAVVGLGKSRRMLLSDTLVERFETEEIKAVMGHELGHHKHRDLLLQLCLSSVGTGFILFATHCLLETATAGWGLSPSAAVQTITLVLTIQVLSLITGPIYNAISRSIEHRADSFALEVTGSGKTYASALEKLAELNLADPSPSRLTEWLFYDHPPIHKRIRHALERSAS